MIRVKATREGLIGQKMASNIPVNTHIPFVALPSVNALYKVVRLRNPANGASCLAMVLDVGPWNVGDNEYVLLGQRPQAESGIDKSGRITNKAGIDIGEKVWKDLDMRDNTEVEWEFVS